MPRLWPILAILAGVIVVLVVLFGGDDVDDGSLPDRDDFIDGDEKSPELIAAEAIRQKKEADAEAARRAAAAKAREAERGRKQVLVLTGAVVDASTGRPVVGATLMPEVAREPCPRLPWSLERALRGIPVAQAGSGFTPHPLPPPVVTGADGRFRWVADAAGFPRKLDVFVDAAGYVTQALCAPELGSDVTVRLERALKLKVLVADRHGRPVEDATVAVRPGEETEGVLGHAGLGTTDEFGRCEIDGLRPGQVLVTGDHPAYMPVQEGPLDPKLQREVELRLPPAMRFSFVLRSDDGSPIKGPILEASTDGDPPHEIGPLLLDVKAAGPPATPLAELTSQPVRIPCEHRNVRLQLKADGFELLRLPPEPLPVEGGEKELIAILTRDTSLASLRVRFTDEDGKPVPYTDLGETLPSIVNLDGKEIGSIKLESGETLTFPSLPAGRYRIGKRGPDFAPAEVDVTVRAGEPNEVTVKLKKPAKLQVVFRATEPITVRFRLRRNGRLLPAFPVQQAADGTQATGHEPLVARGSEGATFTGLGAGPVTIDVTDPTLAAEETTVQLREGETTEVEIDVRRR